MSIFRAVKQVLWCVKEIAKAEWRIIKPYDWAAKEKWLGHKFECGVTVHAIPESYDELDMLMDAPREATIRMAVLYGDRVVLTKGTAKWPSSRDKYFVNFGTWHLGVEESWTHSLRNNILTFVHYADN